MSNRMNLASERFRLARQRQALALMHELLDHHPATFIHSERLGLLALSVAVHLQFSPRRRERVVLASRLHDLGKKDVPAQILDKSAPLSAEEWELFLAHPCRGAEVVARY